MSATPKKYYRPSFTEEELRYVLANAKERYHQYGDSLPKKIVQKLSALTAKIDNNAIAPAFTSTPKLSLMEVLGAVGMEDKLEPMDKVTYNKECYKEYQLYSSYNKLYELSLAKLEAAKEHMYVNDLMTEKEELAYELEEDSKDS